MSLRPECPRCPQSLQGGGEDWRCPTHEGVAPLWRGATADYESFAEYLGRAEPLATWLPWPLPPGWQVTDFGAVRGGPAGDEARAAVVGLVGASEAEGVVELAVVSEEPGVGLGARVAGVEQADPGREAGVGSPLLKIRVDGNAVPLWPVSVPEDEPLLDRAVLVGEAAGRWLWVVVRPASAVLLLPDLPEVLDVSGLGPELVALPFGVVPPAW
jgi:hypothetical protein